MVAAQQPANTGAAPPEKTPAPGRATAPAGAQAGAAPKVQPEDSWALDVEVTFAGTLLRLRVVVSGSDKVKDVLRKVRTRTGYGVSCLSRVSGGSPMPPEDPLHLHLEVGTCLLFATGTPEGATPIEYGGPPIVSADLHFCMACRVRTATPEHMQAHMMTAEHVARVAEYVTAFMDLRVLRGPGVPSS